MTFFLLQSTPVRPPAKERHPLPQKSKEVVQEPCAEKVEGDHDSYQFCCQCSPDCSCPGCLDKNKEILRLRHEVETLKEALVTKKLRGKKRTLCGKFLKTDKKTQLHTGLPSKNTFHSLLDYLKPKAGKMKYWLGTKKVTSTKVKRRFAKSPKKFGPRRKLPQEDEFLVVLMKLRHGLTNQLLADMCGIVVSTVSQVFNTWIKLLADELKPLVFWPDKVSVQRNMPRSLQVHYPGLRCTLDCTEVYIERPRHLKLQALTWSDYKKHNTAKFLVGIAPSGMITFLSSVGGGHQTRLPEKVDSSIWWLLIG